MVVAQYAAKTFALGIERSKQPRERPSAVSSQDKRDHVARRGPVRVFVGADDGEEGVGRHLEGEPAGPGGTAADLVPIQPARPW